jgi:hypothetical protein
MKRFGPTKTTRTILAVLDLAYHRKLPLATAIDVYIRENQASMRRLRGRMRDPNRRAFHETYGKIVANIRRENRRVRDLTREYASWRA